ADHRDPALQPAQHRAQLQREAIARDEKERDHRARERRENDSGEEDGEHGRTAAEAREPPHQRDRDESAGERGERHERGGEPEDDRGHGGKRRAGGRAHDERGHEEGEDRKRAHYRKSSGWTSFAYASAASPTRGPGRLIRFGSIVKMRLFLTAAMIDQPCRAATSPGFEEYASAERTMISGSPRRISSAESWAHADPAHAPM